MGYRDVIRLRGSVKLIVWKYSESVQLHLLKVSEKSNTFKLVIGIHVLYTKFMLYLRALLWFWGLIFYWQCSWKSVFLELTLLARWDTYQLSSEVSQQEDSELLTLRAIPGCSVSFLLLPDSTRMYVSNFLLRIMPFCLQTHLPTLGFSIRPFRMEFLVEKVELGENFLRIIRCLSVSHHSIYIFH